MRATLVPILSHFAGAVWWSSPLRRASETAQIAGSRTPHISTALREVGLGGFEGARTNARVHEHSELVSAWRAGHCFHETPMGCEPATSGAQRLAHFLMGVMRARDRDVLHISVTHFGLLNALIGSGVVEVSVLHAEPGFPQHLQGLLCTHGPTGKLRCEPWLVRS